MKLRYRFTGQNLPKPIWSCPKMDRTKKFMNQVSKEINVPQRKSPISGKISIRKNDFIVWSIIVARMTVSLKSGHAVLRPIEGRGQAEGQERGHTGTRGQGELWQQWISKPKAATFTRQREEHGDKMEEIDPDAPTSNGDASADGPPSNWKTFKGDIKELGLPEVDDGAGEQKKCKRCKKQPSRICKECCNEVRQDENDDQTLMCDECEFSTTYTAWTSSRVHPDGDWYCKCLPRTMRILSSKKDNSRLLREPQCLINTFPRDWVRALPPLAGPRSAQSTS